MDLLPDFNINLQVQTAAVEVRVTAPAAAFSSWRNCSDAH